MAPLLWWGLPGSDRDRYLFGGDPPWPAERYDVEAEVARLRKRTAGADTDLNPITARNQLIDLTATTEDRAEILRRYRLFSRQPDEMIILRALQRMQPRELDFDPRLYQYGGAYVYLVGAAIGVSGGVGFFPITSDAGYYLEHPDDFAGFYVAARAVSLIFAALALVGIYKLARRVGGQFAGWTALVLAAALPVFISGSLEAKPHLPAACLLIWATLSALDFRATGRRGDAVRMGAQVGLACGMVLTGVAGALLWVGLLISRPAAPWRRTLSQLAAAGGVAAAVYLLTNPYVPYNLLFNPDVLASNIGNSTAMYENQLARAPAGLLNVVGLLYLGAGPLLPLLGIAGFIVLAWRYKGEVFIGAAAALGILLIAVLTGAGKPAEFGRFLVLPALLLTVAAAWVLSRLAHKHKAAGIVATVLLLATLGVPAYLSSFIIDARGENESRLQAARYLAEIAAPADAVGVLQEPAPYSIPPFDFTQRKIFLLPAAPAEVIPVDQLPAWLVYTADQRYTPFAWQQAGLYELTARFPSADIPLSPITWANKPVFIYRRASSIDHSEPQIISPANPAQ